MLRCQLFASTMASQMQLTCHLQLYPGKYIECEHHSPSDSALFSVSEQKIWANGMVSHLSLDVRRIRKRVIGFSDWKANI